MGDSEEDRGGTSKMTKHLSSINWCARYNTPESLHNKWSNAHGVDGGCQSGECGGRGALEKKERGLCKNEKDVLARI